MKRLLAVFIAVCFGFMQVNAQQMVVTGTVTNSATGEALPSVSIQVKGTNLGTQTNSRGEFSIRVSENAILAFNSIGFEGQEVKVGTRSVVNVQLKAVSSELSEVIVIGYGTASKRDLTGSSVSIKAKDIANKPTTNPISAIQGKVAGVQIVNNGRAGAEPDIRIRGTNSINNVKPLYVVDGILTDNINFLNPADIESMDILKDPSSLAIFGVRGASGVIAITTKRAKTGQVLVNFNSSVGVKNVSNRDRVKLTNASEFKMLYDEQRKNEAIDLGQAYVPYDYDIWKANTNWQDEIFQNGVLNYNNISVTGATERNKFYMGAGYITEQGVIKNEKLQKITLSINDEYKVSKALKFGFNFNGYRAKLPQERDADAALLAAPIAEPYNSEYGLYSVLPDFQRAQVGNPLATIEGRKNTEIKYEYRAVGNMYGELNFLKDFTFRAALYGDYGFNTTRSYYPRVYMYNPYLPGKIDSTTARVTSVYQGQNVYTKIQQDYMLTYKKKWGNHSLTALGGFSSYFNSYENVNASRNDGGGIPIPNDPRFWYVKIGSVDAQNGNSDAWETATLSYLVRALYSYQGRYLLNASFRRDGTSAFPMNKWQNFGAVGAAWIVTEENFMKDQSWLDYLKVKASWGVLGNQGSGDNKYPYYPKLDNGTAIFGDNVITTLFPAYIPDPNIHWEAVHSWEAGVELSTLNNKLRFEGAYYRKLTKDILVTVDAIASAGITAGMGNKGTVLNNGVELFASYNDNITKDLSYSISGNFTTINNKVEFLVDKGHEIIDVASRTKVGYPIGYFYGYEVEGVYQTYTDIIKSVPNTVYAVSPGDFKFKDVDGDGQITTNDRTMIGNPTPDFTYGISASLNYKGFDFGIDMMGVYGNEIFRDRGRNPYAQFNYPTYKLDRWNAPATSNWEPILSNTRAINSVISSYYIEDGSYFRIRNIQLGYNFSTSLLNKVYIKSLRVYANAQNPFTFKRNYGYTPEFGGSATSFGVDRGTYPMPAIYTLGLNLNF